MKIEKMNLTKVENVYTEDLIKTMENEYETYHNILNDLIELSIEHYIDYLENLDGIKFYQYNFGSVFSNDYVAEITNIDEFLSNNFNQDNFTFYDLLEVLKKDKENKKLQKQVLDMLFTEVDELATYEAYDVDEVVDYERDYFDAWLDGCAIDLNTHKLYDSYDLEDLEVDYQDLD